MLLVAKKSFWVAILLAVLLYISSKPVLSQSGLLIGAVAQNKTSVNLYDKLELYFPITGSVATNLNFPYDATTVAGLATKIGITVDGLFLPPGETNWNHAIIQPAFLYQPTQIDRTTTTGNINSEWIYPTGEPYWVVRFAPKQKGKWQFKVRAQDNSNYPGWTESAIGSFTVTEARVGVHGFVQVSQADRRYFEYSDGTPFVGAGYNSADRGIIHSEQRAAQDFSLFKKSGITFYRIWMSMESIWSRGTHGWDGWKTVGGTADLLRVSEQRYIEPSGLDHDVSIKLSSGTNYIAQFSDGNQFLAGGLEIGKKYKVRIRAKFTSGSETALEVRLQSSGSNFSSGTKLAPNGSWNKTNLSNGWALYESSFTNTSGRLLFQNSSALGVGLSGTATVYLDEIYIGEDLGNGKIGPNVVFKGKLNYHQYYDPIASANWDRIIEHAEKNGVALKIVISDKQDMLLTRIDKNTTLFDPKITLDQHQNFYSERGLKVRRLHEYWWRYLAARWGYSRGVHSWELVNEGGPGMAHFDIANHLAEVIEQLDKNHMATTSFWYGFYENFWGNTAYPSLNYADVHAYTSTGTIIDPILNDPSMISDTAKYHFLYSQVLNSKLKATSRYLPIVRGEAGIDQTINNQSENQDYDNDKYGVWLHNFTWARVHPGGLYDLYWWSNVLRNDPDAGIVGPDGIGANGLHEIWKPYNDFMCNVPVNQGGYVDIGITASGNNRILGQKNNNGSSSTLAHLWIQDTRHQWKTPESGSLSGTFMISGMKPSTTFPVEFWYFNTKGQLTKNNQNLTSNSSGQLTLMVSPATYNGSAIVDIAVKIGTYSACSSPATEIPGDANEDQLVDIVDFKIMIGNYAKLLFGQTTGDFDENGLINILDYGTWFKNHSL